VRHLRLAGVTASILSRSAWSERAEAHRRRAEHWTLPHLARRARGDKHPVDDFLWEYYDLGPGRLARWHPGLGVALADAPEYAALGSYVVHHGAVSVDPARVHRRRPGLEWTRELLLRTAERPMHRGCFGLHEWAMVYRDRDLRHPQLKLRLGSAGTDQVVESHRLSCTHVDAFRFFTVAATPRNDRPLGRADQLAIEQPGCLHATMDLYKAAYRLLPFVDATIVLDTFELALDVRRVDMRASPYDVRPLDLEPIAIETADGKAEYLDHQDRFARRAAPLRQRLIDLHDQVLSVDAPR